MRLLFFVTILFEFTLGQWRASASAPSNSLPARRAAAGSWGRPPAPIYTHIQRGRSHQSGRKTCARDATRGVMLRRCFANDGRLSADAGCSTDDDDDSAHLRCLIPCVGGSRPRQRSDSCAPAEQHNAPAALWRGPQQRRR